MRALWGTVSLRISSRLPGSTAPSQLKPVMFPPGFARLATNPAATASGGAAITIGIVRAAQHATRTIPIVMAAPPDAVAAGFVASLANPGGNITGLSWLGAVLPGKRLEILKETVPQSARIAVLANPAYEAYGTW